MELKKAKPVEDTDIIHTFLSLPKNYNKDRARKIKNMKVKADDIWIISIPRSGSTWTQEMVWLLCNGLNYEAAKNQDIADRCPFLEFSVISEHINYDTSLSSVHTVIKFPSRRFIKSHLPIELLPKELTSVMPKLIYVYRNPKDVVISQYHFVKMAKEYHGTFEEWAEAFLANKCNYTPYWDNVLKFWNLRKKLNILFLNYDDMKKDLLKEVYNVADYLKVTITPDEATTLTNHLDYKNMKHNLSVNHEQLLLMMGGIWKKEDSNFIRTGISGEWRSFMSKEMIHKFDTWSAAAIADSDFPFYY